MYGLGFRTWGALFCSARDQHEDHTDGVEQIGKVDQVDCILHLNH